MVQPGDASTVSGVRLDTSGVVDAYPHEGGEIVPQVRWPDLSPFEQGYVEAIKQAHFALQLPPSMKPEDDPDGDISLDWTFSDLAPETLAAIRKDCAAFAATYYPGRAEGRWDGKNFWRERQARAWPETFPPLTVTLGDDGKVRFSPDAAASERSVPAREGE